MMFCLYLQSDGLREQCQEKKSVINSSCNFLKLHAGHPHHIMDNPGDSCTPKKKHHTGTPFLIFSSILTSNGQKTPLCSLLFFLKKHLSIITNLAKPMLLIREQHGRTLLYKEAP